MDEELNNAQVSDSGGGPPGSNTSTFKRVIAIIAVIALLAIGVGVLPVLLANKQADLNKETQASNASYEAAAKLKLKIPSRGLTSDEISGLTPESELLKDAEVSFDIPYAEDNKCAVIFFKSANVSVESEAGTLTKNALSEGIVFIWTGNGEEKAELNVSEGANKYTVSLEDAGNGKYKVSVASAD